jgi:hypothetical protein
MKTYTEVHLEGVVDEPLESSQSTNHENTDWQSVPQTAETDLAVDSANGLASALAGLAVAVEFRDHYIYEQSAIAFQFRLCAIEKVAYCTEDTRNITTQERNTRLLQAIIALFRLTQEAVNPRNSLFKCRKLDHCIRDLPCPQRVQSLVQSTHTLFPYNLGPSLPQIMCKRRKRSLHANLDCFH